MQTNYLIIGQGLSGTWLSYYLQKANQSFFVIDQNDSNAASRLNAGIINPVSGRRHAAVWMVDSIIPFAVQAYEELGASLGSRLIVQKDIIDFFPTEQMQHSFEKRVGEKAPFVSFDANHQDFSSYFQYTHGFGRISPVYAVRTKHLLDAWRQQLLEKNILSDEEFIPDALQVEPSGIRYKNIQAKKIIFCNGHSCSGNPFFSKLPFAPNKGEALIVSIPGLPDGLTFKKSVAIVPLAEKDLWWTGSTYEWNYTNDQPTAGFLAKTTAALQDWLKIPFHIEKHISGIRPATLERRPFVGVHPQVPQIAILNGLGTKGCSLAPYFANQLVEFLMEHKNISPEADVRRFQKILRRH